MFSLLPFQVNCWHFQMTLWKTCPSSFKKFLLVHTQLDSYSRFRIIESFGSYAGTLIYRPWWKYWGRDYLYVVLVQGEQLTKYKQTHQSTFPQNVGPVILNPAFMGHFSADIRVIASPSWVPAKFTPSEWSIALHGRGSR